MPKLAIYVPKVEMKRIDRWRKEINFSRVFMRALNDEIARRERENQQGRGKSDTWPSDAGPSDAWPSDAWPSDVVNQAARFYAAQLAESSEKRYEKLGRQAAFEDVVHCRWNVDEIEQICATSGDDEQLADRLLKRIDQRRNDFSVPADRDAVQAWLAGYRRGVDEAWQEIVKRIEKQADLSRNVHSDNENR